MTASKRVADEYAAQGYLVARLPADYLGSDTRVNWLLRLGEVAADGDGDSDAADCTPALGEYMATRYLCGNDADAHADDGFLSWDIVDSQPAALPRVDGDAQDAVLCEFLAMYDAELARYDAPQEFPLFMYMTRESEPHTARPINSFYAAVGLLSLHPPRAVVELQANNTQENYFMTERIELVPPGRSGAAAGLAQLVVVYLNQAASGSGLTSNIQIYDADTHNRIPFESTILTGPDLPPLAADNYPVPPAARSVHQQSPVCGAQSYDVDALVAAGVTAVYVCERVCYGQQNLNHVLDVSVVQSRVFIGYQPIV
jgi:hypothetical protein